MSSQTNLLQIEWEFDKALTFEPMQELKDWGLALSTSQHSAAGAGRRNTR